MTRHPLLVATAVVHVPTWTENVHDEIGYPRSDACIILRFPNTFNIKSDQFSILKTSSKWKRLIKRT